MSARHAVPAEAYAPARKRARRHAPEPMPASLAEFLTLLIRFLRACITGYVRRSGLHAWLHERPDLPLASAQALAASVRGHFGNSIAWMYDGAGEFRPILVPRADAAAAARALPLPA
jgi:hypothetical protein